MHKKAVQWDQISQIKEVLSVDESTGKVVQTVFFDYEVR